MAGDPLLIEQYRLLHQDPEAFPGRTTSARHMYEIGIMIKRNRVNNLLDYGCGKAWQYSVDHIHIWWAAVRGWQGAQIVSGMPVRKYDPGVPSFADEPDPTRDRFDGVLCIDVMEHLSEADVLPIMCDLVQMAQKMLFVTACTREAKRMLPDGRNAHVTIREENWWRDRFATAVKRGHKSSTFDAKLEFTL